MRKRFSRPLIFRPRWTVSPGSASIPTANVSSPPWPSFRSISGCSKASELLTEELIGPAAASLSSYHNLMRTVLTLLAVAAVGSAQTNPAGLAARKWREQHEHAILQEFIGLLSIPNISTDHGGARKTAEKIVEMFQARGVAARLVDFSGANPVVFGQITTPGATRTIALYAHYDGQPLDPKEWATPPFTPVLRGGPIEKDGVLIPCLPRKSHQA